jgi:hypothetical protein
MSKEDVTGDVAGDRDGAGDPLSVKPGCASRGGRAEQASENVHDPAVYLLGQIGLTGPKAGLHVHEGQIFLTGGQGAAKRAIGIADHNNGSGTIAPQNLGGAGQYRGCLGGGGPRADLKEVVGTGDLELLIEQGT